MWHRVAFMDGRGPSPRSGHCVVSLGSKLWLFGGRHKHELLNDTWCYDSDTTSWTLVPTTGTIPLTRHCACMNAFVTQDGEPLMVVFGGVHGPTRLSDVAVLHMNPSGGAWEYPSTRGSPPSARSHATSVIYGSKLLIFGGLAPPQTLADLYALDLVTYQWTSMRTKGEQPEPRLSATAVVHRNTLYLFGGYNGKARFQDVHALALDTLEWRKLMTTGRSPGGRHGHHAVLVNDSHMVCLCGSDGSALPLQDVMALDLVTHEWKEMPEAHMGRCGMQHRHSFACANDTTVEGGMRIQCVGGFAKSDGDDVSTWLREVFTLDLRNVSFINHSLASCKHQLLDDVKSLHTLLNDVTACEGNSKGRVDDAVGQSGAHPPSPDLTATPSPGASPTSPVTGSSATPVNGGTTNAATATGDATAEPSTLDSPIQRAVYTMLQHADQVVRKLHEQEALVEESRLREQQRLQRLRHQLDSEREALHCIGWGEVDQVVRLNVGGHMYTTSVNTLTRNPHTMLASMFSGRFSMNSKLEDGSWFIDRDGTYFRYILNWLRDGSCWLPHGNEEALSNLLAEANFYQIGDLATHVSVALQRLLDPDTVIHTPLSPVLPTAAARTTSHEGGRGGE